MTGPFPSGPADRPLDRKLREPALRAAVAYWDSLREGRLVPPRMVLDPAALRPHLRDIAILEAVRPGTLRIRLGGARVSALMGMEVRGMPLRALFDLADRARVSDAAQATLDDPAILLLDVVSPAPRFGRPADGTLAAQVVLLPMTDADLAVTRLLYVMGIADAGHAETWTAGIDRGHRWSVAGMHRIPLRVGAPVITPERLPARAPAAPVGEAESEARGPLARARFRVIEGGLA